MKFKDIKEHFEKVMYNQITIILIYLSFFKPLILYYMRPINAIYNAIMAFAGITILLFYVIEYIGNKEKSRLQISLLIYILALTLSTIVGSKDFSTLFKTYIKWLAISMYTELLIKNNLKGLLNGLSGIIYSYITINVATSLIFKNGIFNPDGLTPVYFLGNDNTTTIMLVLGVLFIWIRSIYFKNKLDFLSITSMIMVLLLYIKDWSVTAMIGASFLVFYLVFLYKRNKKAKIFNYRNYMILGLILFVLVVIFRIQYNFQDIIEKNLKKSVTFTGRTLIWDRCIEQISDNPILGLGVEEFEVRDKTLNIFHAHCTYLNILLEGGLLAFILFYNILFTAYSKIKKNKVYEISNIISFGFLIYFIVGLVEVYQDSQMFYVFLAMTFYIDEITKQYDRINSEKINVEERVNNKMKKNILVIISGGLPIPSIKGGAVETLIDMYIDKNEKDAEYNFEVYSTYCKDIEKVNQNYKNCKFSYIHTNNFLYQLKRYARAFAHKILHLPVNFEFINEVIKDIEKNNKDYDLVIVENNASLVPPLAKKFPNKVILHLHNDNVNNKVQDGKLIYDSCRRIYTVSDYIKSRVGTLGKDNKVVTLFNGIDTEHFIKQNTLENRRRIRNKYGIAENDIVFVFSGRICDDKGVKELLEAFIKVKNNNKNAKLMIIGASFFSGTNKTKYIKELIEVSKIYENDIIFTGYINYKDMGAIYSSADVQVVPSKFDDPCPLTVIEGMTMGLPQIVSNCGGIPEEVTEENAIKVDRKNIVNELVDAMNKLINDKELREKMSTESLKRSQLFTKEKYTDNFFKLIKTEFKQE